MTIADDLWCGPACNLLTTVLKRSANMNSKEFADKYLFGPISILKFQPSWHHDSDYNYIGGHTFYSSYDLAKNWATAAFRWRKTLNQQIVSKEWLEKSFQVV